MIRREMGNEFFLITQDDHARLAFQLAEHFGNQRFEKPLPRQSMLDGIRLHDAGWPLHDDAPTLNNRHLPLDVFEVPRAVALKVWSASADRAAAVDPYAGLLVSLHSLALSIFATANAPPQHEIFDVNQLTERFEVNKFQHREVERQENLRRQLGMRTDLPLTHGLAEPRASADEDRLTMNFRLLQAMDLISLYLCCNIPPATKTQDILPKPGQPAVHLRLNRRSDATVVVDPWPFDADRIELAIPYRPVPNRIFRDNTELGEIYSTSMVKHLPLMVCHG